MSSLDSSMNSLSSVVVNDYYKRFNPNTTEAKSVIFPKLTRLTMCRRNPLKPHRERLCPRRTYGGAGEYREQHDGPIHR